jgi:hypothetical protein
MAATANVTPEKRKRTRSPAYPFVNLETAITRAKQFFDKEQRNAANISVAVTHWGYGNESSNGAQTIAALTSFGLLQDEGIGDKRKVRLTQNALRILLDARPDSKERAELVKQAALAPKIHQQLWEKWGTNLPSDAQLRHTLLLEWPIPFNENAVDGFIREYRETVAFAKLLEFDKLDLEVQDNGGEGTGEYIPKVGDYVQWELAGQDQFREPKPIRRFDEHGGQRFAFFDGSHTGAPVDQLRPTQAPAISLPPQFSEQRLPLPPKTRMQEFVVPLSNGSRAVFQWPSILSAEDKADLQDSLKIVERKILRAEKVEQTTETFLPRGTPES